MWLYCGQSYLGKTPMELNHKPWVSYVVYTFLWIKLYTGYILYILADIILINGMKALYITLLISELYYGYSDASETILTNVFR